MLLCKYQSSQQMYKKYRNFKIIIFAYTFLAQRAEAALFVVIGLM